MRKTTSVILAFVIIIGLTLPACKKSASPEELELKSTERAEQAAKQEQAKRLAVEKKKAEREKKIARVKGFQVAGRWVLRKKVSLSTGKTELLLTLTPISSDDGRNSGKSPPFLSIRCLEGELGVFLIYSDFLGSRMKEVSQRFDKGKTRIVHWQVDRDGKTMKATNPRQLAEKLLLTEKFVVGVTPHREKPNRAIFDVRGLYHVSHPFRKACNFGEL